MASSIKQISLNGNWQLRFESLSCESSDFKNISENKNGWISTPVPGDIRQGLISAGLISEPSSGMNAAESTWIEERSWWLKTSFQVDKSAIEADLVEMELNGLDCKASIFLNDNHIGDHPSAFRPFIARINKYLVEGENVLLVRLTHGLEGIPEGPLDALGGLIATEVLNGHPERGDRRRVFVRKPQFTWGWDWSPRVATVGITGECKIWVANKVCIRDVQAKAVFNGSHVELTTAIAVEWLEMFRCGTGTVNIEVADEEGNIVFSKDKNVLLQTGINFCDLTASIENVKLWWPSGMGPQHRYTITARIKSGTDTDLYSFKYGIRHIQLETAETFGLSINGKRVFCKGGNWVPPDTIYGRITNEKLDKLVAEAKAANFNMLRIWGGGLYEREAFYEACDRNGIMLWHDFMFACSPYPDHLESFKDEIRKEAEYQTKRLSKHASLVLWCGNNECIFTQLPGTEKETRSSSEIMGRILPEIVRHNCPEIPYWYSSPYGAGANWNHHDSEYVGDCHFWGSGTMHLDPTKRFTYEAYDNSKSMFVTEYGFIGPCSEETTLEYLGGTPLDFNNDVWQYHLNTSERGMNALNDAIEKSYLKKSELEPGEYLLLGGLVQGQMYHHSLDSFRSKQHCNGALFWMYNDAWGEIGWSIIDYYLRRKISWYFVKRALAHKRLVLRNQGNEMVCTVVNDSQDAITGMLEYGYISLDGKIKKIVNSRVSAPALAKTDAMKFDKGNNDAARGIWYARFLDNDELTPAILKLADFRIMDYSIPNLKYNIILSNKDEYSITISTDTYAHAVRLRLPGGAVAEDNYFDLLPDQTYTIVVKNPQPLSKQNVTVEPFSLTHKKAKHHIEPRLHIKNAVTRLEA